MIKFSNLNSDDEPQTFNPVKKKNPLRRISESFSSAFSDKNSPLTSFQSLDGTKLSKLKLTRGKSLESKSPPEPGSSVFM